MKRQYLFDRESYKAGFALITYRMMTSKWVTNADSMASEYTNVRGNICFCISI